MLAIYKTVLDTAKLKLSKLSSSCTFEKEIKLEGASVTVVVEIYRATKNKEMVWDI